MLSISRAKRRALRWYSLKEYRDILVSAVECVNSDDESLVRLIFRRTTMIIRTYLRPMTMSVTILRGMPSPNTWKPTKCSHLSEQIQMRAKSFRVGNIQTISLYHVLLQARLVYIRRTDITMGTLRWPPRNLLEQKWLKTNFKGSLSGVESGLTNYIKAEREHDVVPVLRVQTVRRMISETEKCNLQWKKLMWLVV